MICYNKVLNSNDNNILWTSYHHDGMAYQLELNIKTQRVMFAKRGMFGGRQAILDLSNIEEIREEIVFSFNEEVFNECKRNLMGIL